jgi:hypothetical protein
MTGPTLPPQAYTREILTSAFNWLQTQPESVRKLATTPDALVGLFLRAQRFGNSSLEADAPVSSQSFMSDLKNLAEGLKQFEGPTSEAKRAIAQAPSANNAGLRGAPAANASAGASAPTKGQAPLQGRVPHSRFASAQMDLVTAPGPTVATSMAPLGETPPSSTSPSTTPAVASLANLPPAAGPLGVNEHSLEMIQAVKTALNLSSDVEALNMMVAIAYKNLKNLLA